VVTKALQFTFTHLHALHRTPFLLQLFGSVAQCLDASPDHSDTLDTSKVHASCLLDILLAMEAARTTDDLKIMDLVASTQRYLIALKSYFITITVIYKQKKLLILLYVLFQKPQLLL
jgi:hypothetical protein